MNSLRCLCQTGQLGSRISRVPACHPAFRLLAQRHASTERPSNTGFDEKLAKLASETLARWSADGRSMNSDAVLDAEQAKKVKRYEALKDAFQQWKEVTKLEKELNDVISNDADPDMRELASADLESVTLDLAAARKRLQSVLLAPSEETAQLGCLIEIKSGVGGSEAAIFVADITRMYSRFAAVKERKWKAEIVECAPVATEGGRDAYREVILELDGRGAYEAMRYEAGVHRVQRVPATESAGRVHSSTVAVVVLPSSSGNDASLDNVLDEKDVKIEVMRSGGAGGQHVNRTESAVRLTHLPTGITVSMQDTRSQHKNRQKAFQVLRSRLLARKLSEVQATSRAERRSQVRTLDRSEKIRTYNVPQDRVTDHRIPLTIVGAEGFLDGDDGKLEIMQEEMQRAMMMREVDELLEIATA